MYIGLLKSLTNQWTQETNTFNEAWNFLNTLSLEKKDIIKAVVLKETADSCLNKQFIDLNSFKEIASLRLIK